MVTLEELHRQINRAEWFTKVGTFEGPKLFLSITHIATVFNPMSDVGDGLVWFPDDPATEDPVHGDELERLAHDRAQAPEVRMATLTTVKRARISLRSMRPQPLLDVRSGDLTERAKESALYAARRATTELVLGRSGVWAGLIPLYRIGHWPLGRMPNGQIAVY